MTPAEFHRDILPLGDGLYRIAFFILEDEAEARDAVQDLYAKLWSLRDALDGVRNLQAYCHTLMRNLCLDRVRSAERSRTGPLERDFAEDTDTEEALLQKERLRRTFEAIQTLPERQKMVLVKHVLEEKTYPEISRETGIPYLTLRVLLSQARKAIRNKI